jgi:penicillin-binding protein 1C
MRGCSASRSPHFGASSLSCAGRKVEDGAVVVLDNATGDVLAWVGSSGKFSGAAEVDGVLARRQPGSTLKPFVYELAFEQRFITPATLLDDSPAQLATASGLYLPQNYDRRFKGWVSARTALGASLNVPAVRVGAMLGADALFARLNALGLALPESGGYYGASLALGSADVTLLALTNAYRALANGGVYRDVNLNGRAGAGRRVADARAAWLVTDILGDHTARARTFGLASALNTRGFAAVKTGTSKDMRDNWCIGFTDRYTIGVWIGNAGGDAMHDVSGVSGAAPIWQALALHLHAGSPSRMPATPSGVVRARAEFDASARAFARGILHRRHAGAQAGRRHDGSGVGLWHREPARRQSVRHRSRHAARCPADHVRGRRRHVGARRQTRGIRADDALGALAGAARTYADRAQRQDCRDRALRSARRGS